MRNLVLENKDNVADFAGRIEAAREEAAALHLEIEQLEEEVRVQRAEFAEIRHEIENGFKNSSVTAGDRLELHARSDMLSSEISTKEAGLASLRLKLAPLRAQLRQWYMERAMVELDEVKGLMAAPSDRLGAAVTELAAAWREYEEAAKAMIAWDTRAKNALGADRRKLPTFRNPADLSPMVLAASRELAKEESFLKSWRANGRGLAGAKRIKAAPGAGAFIAADRFIVRGAERLGGLPGPAVIKPDIF